MLEYKFKDQIIEEIKINAQRERKIYLIEEFDRESIFKVIRALDKITSNDIRSGIKPEDAQPIWLFEDSYGGCLHSCFALISTMKRYQKLGWKINAVAMGRNQSASFFAFICANKRYALELCSHMVHDQRAFEYGYKTVRDKRVELEEWEKEWQRLKDIVTEHTFITEEQLEWYVERRRDWDMTTQEAIELGACDFVY